MLRSIAHKECFRRRHSEQQRIGKIWTFCDVYAIVIGCYLHITSYFDFV